MIYLFFLFYLFFLTLQVERISFDFSPFALDFSFLIPLARVESIIVVGVAVDSVSWLLFRHGAFEFRTCKHFVKIILKNKPDYKLYLYTFGRFYADFKAGNRLRIYWF